MCMSSLRKLYVILICTFWFVSCLCIAHKINFLNLIFKKCTREHYKDGCPNFRGAVIPISADSILSVGGKECEGKNEDSCPINTQEGSYQKIGQNRMQLKNFCLKRYVFMKDEVKSTCPILGEFKKPVSSKSNQTDSSNASLIDPKKNFVTRNKTTTADSTTEPTTSFGNFSHNASADHRILVDSDDAVPQDANISDAVRGKDQLETYSQFAERVNAEKKTSGSGNGAHSSSNGQAASKEKKKVKSKNYASPDCGAKFLSANSASSHAHKIISSNKDEYMLSKCTEKIWAIMELCENINPLLFEIANFELFSNSPKEVHLFGSHRYPTREWTSLGKFTAEEGNRELQAFQISTQQNELFKYVKLEILSYYGTEFFCPLSLFRIYGLSEFEVIEEVEDSDNYQEAAEDKTLTPNQVSEGKVGVFPDVIHSMFRGVYNVLKHRDTLLDTTLHETAKMSDFNCSSLRQDFLMQKQLCQSADSVNYILSCYLNSVRSLILSTKFSEKNKLFCRTLIDRMCDSCNDSPHSTYRYCAGDYFCIMLTPEVVLALCYVQDPTLMGRTVQSSFRYGATVRKSLVFSSSPTPRKSIYNASSFFLYNVLNVNRHFPSFRANGIVVSSFEGRKVLPYHLDYSGIFVRNQINLSKSDLSSSLNVPLREDLSNSKEIPSLSPTSRLPEATSPGDKSAINGEVHQNDSVVPPVNVSRSDAKTSPPTNKESIVVRLSNKVKALEHNISISSQYLEELSQRYKREMQEMQYRFNLTFLALNVSTNEAYERDLQHHIQLKDIEDQVKKINETIFAFGRERSDLISNELEQNLVFLIIEIVLLGVVFLWFLYFRARSVCCHCTVECRSSCFSDVDHANQEPSLSTRYSPHSSSSANRCYDKLESETRNGEMEIFVKSSPVNGTKITEYTMPVIRSSDSHTLFAPHWRRLLPSSGKIIKDDTLFPHVSLSRFAPPLDEIDGVTLSMLNNNVEGEDRFDGSFYSVLGESTLDCDTFYSNVLDLTNDYASEYFSLARALDLTFPRNLFSYRLLLLSLVSAYEYEVFRNVYRGVNFRPIFDLKEYPRRFLRNT